MAEQYPSYKQVYNVQVQLKDVEYQHWIHHDVFSFNWWMLLCVMIVSWTSFAKMVDRKRILELLLYGAFVSLTAAFFDVFGTSLALWGYPDKLLPLIPPFFIFDFVALPVILTLIYQRYDKWKQYLIATVAVALIFSYVLEPFLVWRGVYSLHGWRYTYSLPIYVAIACFFKWLINRLKRMQDEQSQTKK